MPQARRRAREQAGRAPRLARGRVLWQVTGLGAVLDWLQWPRSFVLLVLVPAGLLAILEWRSRRRPAGPRAAEATA
jgi:hypothetical protein